MAEPTKAQIEDWKKKHGEQNIAKLTSRETGKIAIIRTNPSVREMDAALVAGSNGGLGYGKTLFLNLQLWHSPDCDDATMLGFYQRVGEVVKVNEADLEKL